MLPPIKWSIVVDTAQKVTQFYHQIGRLTLFELEIDGKGELLSPKPAMEEGIFNGGIFTMGINNRIQRLNTPMTAAYGFNAPTKWYLCYQLQGILASTHFGIYSQQNRNLFCYDDEANGSQHTMNGRQGERKSDSLPNFSKPNPIWMMPATTIAPRARCQPVSPPKFWNGSCNNDNQASCRSFYGKPWASNHANYYSTNNGGKIRP